MEILGVIDISSLFFEVFFLSLVVLVYVDKGKGKEVVKVEELLFFWFEK